MKTHEKTYGKERIIMASEKLKGKGKGKQTGLAACMKGMRGGGWRNIKKTRILKKREKAKKDQQEEQRGKRGGEHTLIKKKIKFFSYVRKFRMEQLRSHKWLTVYSHMVKYLRISSYIRKPFIINDFETNPIWISLHIRKISFSFNQCYM